MSLSGSDSAFSSRGKQFVFSYKKVVIMKKTLAAVAVLGALTGSALAADVTFYGVVDTGLQYIHEDSDEEGVSAEDLWGMSSGLVLGSRFGLKGTEEIGDGWKVGFVLENGFSSDNGKLGQGGRLFGRESQVNISGPFGTLSMGRVGNLTSGNGSYGLAGALSPFGTTWGDYAANANNVMVGFDRYDNTVTYKSPEMAGLNVYAQYSFDTDTDADYDGNGMHGEEGKSSVDRYYALGVTYSNGPLNLVGIVDCTNYSTLKWSDATTGMVGNWGDKVDDAITVTLGGSYDFNAVKYYLGGQYFKDADLNSVDHIDVGDYVEHFQMDGFGVVTGVDVPVLGGTAKFAAAYVKGTLEKVNGWDMADLPWGEIDLSRWHLTAGYQYNLSKRTFLYGVASYSKSKLETENSGFEAMEVEPSATEVAVGLVHRF